jgi:DNA-binding transcriptional MerR regulator
MSATMTIVAAAAAAGLTPKAVRLYESRGLLAHTERTQAGYRIYTEADLARLQFIAAARSVGLHLNQIGEILAAAHGGQRPCSITRELLDQRINEIDHIVADLSTLRDTLTTARETSTLCAVLDPGFCT